MKNAELTKVMGSGCHFEAVLAGETIHLVEVQTVNKETGELLTSEYKDDFSGEMVRGNHIILHLEVPSKGKGINLAENGFKFRKTIFEMVGLNRVNRIYELLLNHPSIIEAGTDVIFKKPIELDNVWAGMMVPDSAFHFITSGGEKRIGSHKPIVVFGLETEVVKEMHKEMRKMHRNNLFIQLSDVNEEGGVYFVDGSDYKEEEVKEDGFNEQDKAPEKPVNPNPQQNQAPRRP
jgi:hypothetical protein